MVRARAGWAFPVRCAAPDFERHAAKTPGVGKCGLPSHSRRNPEGFLRSSRLKSCFGEHAFSPFSARPGLKGLRSSPDCSKPAPPSPPSDAGAFWLREK